MNKDYDLIVTCPDQIGNKLASDIECGAQLITPKFKIVKSNKKQPRAMAFTEAVLTFIIFLSSGLVAGFVNELGAGGARSLKEFFCALITKVKRHNYRKITQEDCEKEYRLSRVSDKIDKKQLKLQLDNIGIPSPPLSIRFQLSNYYTVDFIFPDDITPKQAQRALSTIKEKLALHLLFAEALPELESKYNDIHHILVHSDFERVYIYSNGEWVVQTPQQITESEHKLRKSQRGITYKK